MTVKRFTLPLIWSFSLGLGFGFDHALAQVNRDTLGKWGYIVLGRGGEGSWFGYKTEAGIIEFKEDGTVQNTYKESADRCPSERYCQEHNSKQLHYAIDETGIIVIEDRVKCVISDGRNVIVCDGTTGGEKPGERFFIAGVRLDDQDNYRPSDIYGESFAGSYEKDLLGGERGSNRLESVVAVIESSYITFREGWENGDGNIHEFPHLEIRLPIELSENGSAQIGEFGTGFLDINRSVLLASNPSRFFPDRGDDFQALGALKKQDRQYSQTDLEGTWAFVGFGDRAGKVRSETGVIQCTASGECTFSIKTAEQNASPKWTKITREIRVSADGGLNGFHITSSKPHVSGALGDDGKVMILLLNESNDTTDDRLLGLAVKSSQGGVLDLPDLVLSNVSASQSLERGKKIITINYTVQNQGDAPTQKTSKVSFRLIMEEGSYISLGTQKVPRLAPGQLFEGSKIVKIKRSIPHGSYRLSVVVDPKDAIKESREDNNEMEVEIEM